MTRAAKIVEIVNENDEISCQNVMKELHKQGWGGKSDSISSQLSALVKNKYIQYSDKKTSRGGQMYSPIKKPILKIKLNFHETTSDN